MTDYPPTSHKIMTLKFFESGLPWIFFFICLMHCYMEVQARNPKSLVAEGFIAADNHPDCMPHSTGEIG